MKRLPPLNDDSPPEHWEAEAEKLGVPVEVLREQIRLADEVMEEIVREESSERNPIVVGSLVKNSDIRPTSIPAYAAARGTVVWVSDTGDALRVHWRSDSSPEPFPRRAATVVLAEDD